MALSEKWDQANGVSTPIPIQPRAEICVNTNCQFYNLAVNQCALAGCIFNPPEIVDMQMTRRCALCGAAFVTTVGSSEVICPSCKSRVMSAVRTVEARPWEKD